MKVRFIKEMIFIMAFNVITANNCCKGCNKNRKKSLFNIIERNRKKKKFIEKKKREIMEKKKKKGFITLKLNIHGVTYRITRRKGFKVLELRQDLCGIYAIQNCEVFIPRLKGKELSDEETFGEIAIKGDEITVDIDDTKLQNYIEKIKESNELDEYNRILRGIRDKIKNNRDPYELTY